ncbi:MAG: glutamyl-tRNA reductase, partial [Halobacteria archaeon]|nr:glutamyl-tRNA reductase [Halobacteria archaeon]
LRDAYHTASEGGYLDGTLEKTTVKAIHVGERARTETRINEGNASMGSAAVEVAKEHLGSLDGTNAVVIGAGDMSELVAKAFAKRDDYDYCEIYVANRTYERASHLADEIGGVPIKFADLSDYLAEADIVVTATSAPHLIFDKSDLEGYDLLAMDLANPRDIEEDAERLEGIDLVDIDDLSDVSDSSIETRKEAAERVESLIDDEMKVLEEQIKQERAMDILSTIYARAEEIRENETEKALQRLDGIDEDDEEVINDLTESLVNQLLSTPTQALKNAAASEDYDTLRSASQIFRLGAEIDDDTNEKEESYS